MNKLTNRIIKIHEISILEEVQRCKGRVFREGRHHGPAVAISTTAARQGYRFSRRRVYHDHHALEAFIVLHQDPSVAYKGVHRDNSLFSALT
jgi:hypothetical protein